MLVTNAGLGELRPEHSAALFIRHIAINRALYPNPILTLTLQSGLDALKCLDIIGLCKRGA